MTYHITSPDQLDRIADAMQARMVKDAETRLTGPRVAAQTVHYQVVDNGLDWKGRWSHRFALQRKDEYRKSRVLPRIAFSDTSAETLFDAMHEAEKFHVDNMPHCGGF
jgi:hypothetical protein